MMFTAKVIHYFVIHKFVYYFLYKYVFYNRVKYKIVYRLMWCFSIGCIVFIDEKTLQRRLVDETGCSVMMGVKSAANS